MRRQIARIVMIATLAAAGTALANGPPPPPRRTPPPSQPNAQQGKQVINAESTLWNAAGGVMLGIGGAALLTVGGFCLLRRTNR